MIRPFSSLNKTSCSWNLSCTVALLGGGDGDGGIDGAV